MTVHKRRWKHGRRNQTYRIWYSMIARCTDPRHVSYKHYGGKGVTVHESWQGQRGFSAFVAHIGLRPSLGHSIDRIDATKGYEPGNVRWATTLEQNRNKRGTILIEHPDKPGVQITVGALADERGTDYRSLRRKLIQEGKWPSGIEDEEEDPDDEGEEE